MSDITPVDSKPFQSRSGPNYCVYFGVCPPGTKLEHVFTSVFWSKVASTPGCKGCFHVHDLVRLTASDRSFDLFLVVHALRKDGSPILARFPVDPMAAKPAVKLPEAMPRNRDQALEVLGLTSDASEDDIERVGHALRVANHPDRARDEDDRRARESRSKQINAAIDLLLKRKAA